MNIKFIYNNQSSTWDTKSYLYDRVYIISFAISTYFLLSLQKSGNDVCGTCFQFHNLSIANVIKSLTHKCNK